MEQLNCIKIKQKFLLRQSNFKSNLMSAKIRHGPNYPERSFLIVDERSERIDNASLQNLVSKYKLLRFEFQ